jgi:hypothetical protein
MAFDSLLSVSSFLDHLMLDALKAIFVALTEATHLNGGSS